jgi:hypothetical protein
VIGSTLNILYGREEMEDNKLHTTLLAGFILNSDFSFLTPAQIWSKVSVTFFSS